MFERERIKNSLAVQWLGHHAFTAGVLRLIAGWRTKILQPVWLAKKKKKKARKDTQIGSQEVKTL